MFNILDCMSMGEEIDIRGFTSEILYNGNGSFTIDCQSYTLTRASLVKAAAA